MKIPLAYQKTEYDCGPTTMMNALSCLFDREVIPPDVVKYIMMYSLDAYNERGEYGKNGTSQMAMMFMTSWLNHFGRVKQFPVHCEYISGSDVFIGHNSKIVDGLKRGGVVVARVTYDVWHYVLITGCDSRYVYLFDPYYRCRPYKIDGIDLITDKPLTRNRRVRHELLNDEGKGMYAFGDPKIREAVIVFNLDKTKPAENTAFPE